MTTENQLIGMRKTDLDTPVLCLDLELMEQNIRGLQEYLQQHGLQARPHAKTHKCTIIARKQIEAGAIGVCCAKLGEAEAMAEGGVTGILLTSEIVGKTKITRLVNLAAWADVMVVVDSPDNVSALDAAAVGKGVRLKTIVELDVGHDRCGVRSVDEGVRLAQQIANSRGLLLAGIMGYEGHCIRRTPYSERETMARTALAKLVGLKDAIIAAGIPVPIVSSSGTGTYKIAAGVEGVTEVQAGTYATMDTEYRDTGSTEFAMALSLLATVISVPRPDLAYCDMGLKAATTEFGLPVVAHPSGWKLTRLFEEHGRLDRANGPELRVGDKVELYPSHGCTTINLHDHYCATRRGILEAVWPITARGRCR